ncbi:MAG: double zinc ribbon domain-containing protein, partial [Planctomycetota bacterium]
MRWQPLGLLRVVLDAVHGAGDLFLPAACAACDGVLGLGARALCAACRTSIAAQAPARCHRCGSSRSPLLAASRRCPRCRGRALGFRWAAVGGSYEGALRRLVLRLKYGPEPRLAPLVVALVLPQLGPAVQQHAVDALVPVPLHR